MRKEFIFFSFYLLVFIFLLLTSAKVFSQEKYVISKENGDCENAIVLEDTVFGPANPPVGYGKIMEIADGKNNIYYFEKEHNTVWYRFTAPQNCLLTLEIIPADINNDYDFILFRYTDGNFCKDVRNKKIKPVRSNISRNDPGINSITGLSKDADVEYVHSGPGAQFSKALQVKAGEVFYLVADNVYDNGKGHTLILHYIDCSAPGDVYKSILNLNILDKATNQPLKAIVDIFKSNAEGNKKPDFHFTDTAECRLSLDNRQTYYLQIASRGYLNYTREITFLKGQTDINERVEMEKIEPGKNFSIENIFFFGNLDKFLPTSNPALVHLLNFMKENPSVKIEIQGHVNWPNSYAEPSKAQNEFNWTLSQDRAKAVFDYLVKNRIDANRMTYKGFGSTKMLFPDALTPHENLQNRRVEIKIISF